MNNSPLESLIAQAEDNLRERRTKKKRRPKNSAPKSTIIQDRDFPDEELESLIARAERNLTERSARRKQQLQNPASKIIVLYDEDSIRRKKKKNLSKWIDKHLNKEVDEEQKQKVFFRNLSTVIIMFVILAAVIIMVVGGGKRSNRRRLGLKRVNKKNAVKSISLHQLGSNLEGMVQSPSSLIPTHRGIPSTQRPSDYEQSVNRATQTKERDNKNNTETHKGDPEKPAVDRAFDPHFMPVSDGSIGSMEKEEEIRKEVDTNDISGFPEDGDIDKGGKAMPGAGVKVKISDM